MSLTGKWLLLFSKINKRCNLFQNASLACGPLVVTSSREEVIDFTVSFLKQSVSFVMKRPERPDFFFYFLHPMSLVLWLLILGMWCYY